MGYVCFLRYYNSVQIDNNIFRIADDGYKLWLDPKKSAYFHSQSSDIGAPGSITSDIIFV